MRVALVNSNQKTKLYPVALLKIGAWLKSSGHDCQLFDNVLPKAGQFDEIWITTVFTFDVYYVKSMITQAQQRAAVVKVGGISASLLPEFFRKLGVDVHVGLHPDAERFSPDYSLLPESPEYSITHTSRGCIRKCGFCMVPKLETEFQQRQWEADLSPQTKKVLFYDNNWLAKDKTVLFDDIARLHALVKAGRITQMDFNQGLDARLMTEEIAEKLKGLPIAPVRFAFDGMHEDGHYQNAVRMMHKQGFREFMAYVLYNFKDTPEDFYYRLKESVRLTVELKTEVKSFPMRYQPILDIDTFRDFVGKQWTQKQKRAVHKIVASHSTFGQISTVSIPEFEYWFGKDAAEFVRLLSYPELSKLVKKKQAYIRLHPEIRKL